MRLRPRSKRSPLSWGWQLNKVEIKAGDYVLLDDIPARYFELIVFVMTRADFGYALQPLKMKKVDDCIAALESDDERFIAYADSSQISGGCRRFIHEFINLPKPEPFTAWGKELPPVGTECMVVVHDLHLFSDHGQEILRLFDGQEVTIVVHDEQHALFCRTLEEGKIYHSLCAAYFKPVKTKRERDIEALVDHLEKHYEGVQDQSADIVAHRRTVSLRSAEIAYDFIAQRLGGES